MGKFEKDEIAIFVGTTEFGAHLSDMNSEVTILTVHAPYSDASTYLFEIAALAFPDHVIYGVEWLDGGNGYVAEFQLRKRPCQSVEHFHSELKPCDNLFRKRLEPVLNPVPADLEARIRAMFPPTDMALKTLDPYRLQPFDHFFGGFDA